MGAFDLSDKVAVVTGASSGIGRAISEALAGAGAHVVMVGRDSDRLANVAATIASADGDSHTIIEDVCADAAPRRIVEGTRSAFGKLDVLVLAAGIFWPKPFEETTLDDFDAQWRVNVRAVYALIQAAIRDLQQTRGSVILLSSIAGHVGFPNSSAYCATKGAIELMTKALTTEYARSGVRFNAIAPGNIRTPMNAHLLADGAYEHAMLAATPAGRIGETDDIAPAAVFLASDASAYVHGASLLIDGGWAAA
jgi:NAD(P)-dependent dehydrogenase (short-subunit alcohol dehydrogenase family)